MGYAVIPVIAAIVLALHHVFVLDAPRRSKLVVVLVVGLSLVIWRVFPRHSLLATLLQVGAGVYMLMFLRWHNAGS